MSIVCLVCECLLSVSCVNAYLDAGPALPSSRLRFLYNVERPHTCRVPRSAASSVSNYVCVSASVRVCIYACTCVCIYIRMYECTYVCTHIRRCFLINQCNRHLHRYARASCVCAFVWDAISCVYKYLHTHAASAWLRFNRVHVTHGHTACNTFDTFDT